MNMTKLEKALELALATHLLSSLRQVEMSLSIDRMPNSGDIVIVDNSSMYVFINLTELAKAISNDLNL